MDRQQFEEILHRFESFSFTDKFQRAENNTFIACQSLTSIYDLKNRRLYLALTYLCDDGSMKVSWHPEFGYPEMLKHAEVFELMDTKQQEEMLYHLDLFR